MGTAPDVNLHLDEDLNTTSFVDDTPFQNAAICSGDSCPDAGTKGQMREAPLFDGQNDNLSIPHTGHMDFSEFTVGLWVKPTRRTGNPQYLVTKRGTNDPHGTFSLLIPPNSMNVQFSLSPEYNWGYCNDANPLVGLSAVSLIENSWNHVLMTYDRHYMTYYINGAKQGSVPYGYYTGMRACPNDQPITLGNSPNGYHAFSGHLDEAVVYENALSSLEVKALYDHQAAWYDTKNQHRVVIDVDAPIVSVDAADNYINLPTMIPVFASDPSTLVEVVNVTITAPNNSQTNSTLRGNGNGDWIVPFTPSGGGAYTIAVVATDSVGNTSSASKTIYVDDTAPTATLDGSLSSQVMTTADNDVSLFGTVSDPGSPATGVVTNSVVVDVQDWRGVSVEGFQATVSDGNSWSVDYPVVGPVYGRYQVQVGAADAVGNIYTGTVGTIDLDDLGPYADLTLATNTVTGTNGILQGIASDIPYPVQGKLLHLHFEEGAGSTFADSSGNGFAATCSNCPSPDSSQNGSALSFDGIDDALTILSHENLVVTDTTFMAWVKPAWGAGTNGYNPTLLAMDDGSQTGYRWQISDDYQSLILDNGTQSESVPVNLSANEWVHLALTVGKTAVIQATSTVSPRALSPKPWVYKAACPCILVQQLATVVSSADLLMKWLSTMVCLVRK